MAEPIQMRLRSLVLFGAPVVLLVAIILHPFLADELDVAAMAAAVLADSTRWAWAHIMLMIAFAAIMLAVIVIRHMLRTAGEARWSLAAVPLLVGGSTMFIGVWGLEITVAAVANVGGDVEAVLVESDQWFGPLGLVGYALYFLGWPIMAFAVRRSQILERRQTWVVLGATVVILAGLSYPSTAGAYLFSLGLMGFTWMLGYGGLSGANGLFKNTDN